MTKLVPVSMVLALAAATAVGLASPAFSEGMPRVKGHHRVYNYSSHTSTPPGGSAYGLIYGGEPYSGERWGGYGPDGDYGPGRP
jgi:hypothetical protein